MAKSLKKRKYIKRELPIKEESSTIPQVSISGGIPEGMELPDTTTTSSHKDFVYTDLPLSIRQGVENSIKMRKRLGLSDDSRERKAQAIRMFRGDRPR